MLYVGLGVRALLWSVRKRSRFSPSSGRRPGQVRRRTTGRRCTTPGDGVLERAKADDVPLYVVFHDSVLNDDRAARTEMIGRARPDAGRPGEDRALRRRKFYPSSRAESKRSSMSCG